MRVGFIGYGKFSSLRRDLLASICEVTLIGFYDPNSNNKSLKKFNNVNSLIDSVDAVIISVPPAFAPNYVTMCLQNGKDVFCEKPAAKSFNELESVALQQHDQILAYGLNHRVHDSVENIKNHIDQETLGKVLWVRARYGKEVSLDYINSWRSDKSLNGGGILIDQGIHILDILFFLFGNISFMNGVLSSGYLGVEGVEDNAFLTLASHEKNIPISIHSTVSQWRYIFSLEIFCEGGSIILNGLKTRSGNYGKEVLSINPNLRMHKQVQKVEIEYHENNSWKKEMESFVYSCSTRKLYKHAKLDDAIKITKLLDKIYSEALWL